MESITEDYVSFEIAKLLKEKGFEGECFSAYNGNGKLYEFDKEADDNTPYWSDAPTLQMAMKWLRKKYRLFIAVAPFSKIDGCFYYSHTILHLHNSKCDTEYKSDGFNSPEEAIEDALQYCLTNLI